MTALKASSLGRTFGLLAVTAHGLLRAVAGSYCSREQAGIVLTACSCEEEADGKGRDILGT